MVLKTSAGRAYILRQRSTSWQKSPSNSNPRRRQSAHKTLAVRLPAICAEILAVRWSHWPPLLFCTGGLALPHRPGQQSLPDAAALALPPAVASRWLFATAPRPASSPQRPGHHLPDGAPPRRPGQQLHLGAWPVFTAPRQQQTSFGGEKYCGLASNLVHLGRIC